jgi:DNA polymerase-1
MSDKKHFLVIDVNSLVYRAYHALPSLTTKKGELINAVYGFLLVFLKTIKEFHPDFIVATFDLPGPTFRDKIYKAYKAKRPKAPEELLEQIPKVKEILRAFGIPIYQKEGFEADDLIGTITELIKKNRTFSIETIIISGDLDTLQLVNSQTKVYFPRKGVKNAILYDKEKVLERYQIPPEKLPDFKALVGDPSDNIPGVPGIGPKTATELIKKFGNLEGIYKYLKKEATKKASKGKIQSSLKEKLLKYKEQAFFSKKLSEIKKDVKVDFGLEKCQFKGYNKEKVVSLLEKYDFYSLINRLFPASFGSSGHNNSSQQKLIN